MYDIALFVHILGVVLLVGSVTTNLVAVIRAQQAATAEQVACLMAVTTKIGAAIGPAMLLILAPGLYMVFRHGDDGSIRWTSGWVDVAIAVFLVMAVLGPTVETAHAKRLLALAEQAAPGPVPPELDAARRAPAGTFVTFFGAAQIVAFLYLMTNKPGLVGAISACVVAGALGAGTAMVRLRSLASAPIGTMGSGAHGGDGGGRSAAGRRLTSAWNTGRRD